jgi:hypothetical protein
MRTLLLGIIGLFTFAAASQTLKVDSKEYESLKTQGLLTNQTLSLIHI